MKFTPCRVCKFSTGLNVWVWDTSQREEQGENKKLNKCCLKRGGGMCDILQHRQLAKFSSLKLRLTSRFSSLCICSFQPICMFVSLCITFCVYSPLTLCIYAEVSIPISGFSATHRLYIKKKILLDSVSRRP